MIAKSKPTPQYTKTRTIRIDLEVWEELKRLADQHSMQFSTPNEVLRRALSMPPGKRRKT